MTTPETPEWFNIPNALRWAEQYAAVDPLIVTIAMDDCGWPTINPEPGSSETWTSMGVAGVLVATAAVLNSMSHKEFMFGGVVAYGLILPADGIALAVDRRGDSYTVMLPRDAYPAPDHDTHDAAISGLRAMINAISPDPKGLHSKCS